MTILQYLMSFARNIILPSITRWRIIVALRANARGACLACKNQYLFEIKAIVTYRA